MKAEGTGIAGFSVLFTFGAAAGIFLHGRCHFIYQTVCISFFLAAGLAACSALMSSRTPEGTYGTGRRTALLLLASFFFAGLYSASVYALGGSGGSGSGFLSRAAASCAGILKDAIMEIPFSNQESGAMILALLTGDKSQLPAHISESFRISGASHILALSGMHLGVIYIILARAFSVSGNSPAAVRIRSAMIIAVSGFYTLMTGAGASIVRAFLFISFNETARCTHRKRVPMNIFCASLMAQAAMTPDELGSPGFQLSYLAMAGIYLIYPPMQKWYAAPDGHRPGPLKKIWDTAAMSIACQITTAPAVWYYFGTFPQYFLITNMIAIPLSSAAINISILVLLARSAGICPDILVAADEFMISAMCRSLEVISTL